jgi:choline-sulfatase
MRNHDSVPYRYKTPFMGFRTYQYLTGWPSVRGTRVVEEFLDELAEASGRFFAWTHLMDVHGPIHPQSVAESEFATSGILSQFQSHAKRVSDVCDMTTEARYDSAVQHVDSQIQRIINWLQSSNLWEETTLIVTADHGDALYDRGIYGHPQHYLYDELLSVPLIIRVPGRDGSRISQSFSLGWLHEIVSELTELPRMNVPLSSAEEQTHLKNSSKDSIITASSASHRGQSIVTRYQGQKYIKQVGELSGDELRVSQPGLYNLELDPGERNPTQDTVTTLERAAESIEIEEPEVLRSRGKQTSIMESTKDRLKQLGYAE